ncbi:MAG TPA: LptF/LptG family permease, partial [Spirochaetia bacterium]|nr:LptF/LptG family permease [Spirochaetia bacterium]
MNKLHLMLLKSTGLVFLITLLFFMLLLQLIDLFGHLWMYIDRQVPLLDIVQISMYFIPKCVSYAIPIALLFSLSFTLGTLYANNELIGILGSGMSFFALILPVFVLGFLLSVGVFFFEEMVVLPTIKVKTELQEAITRPNAGAAATRDIGFIDRETQIFLKADAFTPQDNSLIGLVLVDRSAPRIIYSDRAQWDGGSWLLPSAWIYEYNQAGTHITGRRVMQYRAVEIRQTPEKLRLTTDTIENMDVVE